ncbi:MAG: ACT domain-containing protein [Gammaproteobacteria bacterium]|nr:ACT domain-containing protein [Gammaproteobacteria bacterium]MDH5802407.1 ACT domain-containing protein [Gammaproteobacteria bacterium]
MKQITIVAQNRPGVVAEITEALAAENINIESLTGDGYADTGVIILTVDRYDDALNLLNRLPDIKALTEDVILIRLDDKPGALAQIARRFKEAQINLRSIRIIRSDNNQSLAAICTDRTEEAMQLVKDELIS